jgi:hypothetical protein
VHLQGHDLGSCQVDFLIGPSGAIEMDFVGKVENLERDFPILCQKLGIEPVPRLPHAFNSRRKFHYSVYYDEESEELVRRRFARDIDYFGYVFERPTPPPPVPELSHPKSKGGKSHAPHPAAITETYA